MTARDLWNLRNSDKASFEDFEAALREYKSEDTNLMDALESSVVQNYLFGNFLKGGSPNELRNTVRKLLDN